MIDEITRISSTKKDLQRFAVVMAVACIIIAGMLFWRQKDYWQGFALAAAAFALLRLTFPMLLLPLHKVWMSIAVAMGWLVSRVVLAALFYIGFAGIGLAGRLVGKKFLDLPVAKEASTYWIRRTVGVKQAGDYEKQF